MLAQKINTLCDSVSAPIEEVRGVIGKLSVNDYTVKVEGNYKGAFKALADDVNMVIERLDVIQDVVTRVSQGDTSKLEEFEKVGRHSENDNMMPAIIAMMKAIENLINEVEHLSVEAVNGNIINARADCKQI